MNEAETAKHLLVLKRFAGQFRSGAQGAFFEEADDAKALAEAIDAVLLLATPEPGSLAERLVAEADAMYAAVQGEHVGGTFHAFNWADKPHRVVYDAVALLREAAAALNARQEKAELPAFTASEAAMMPGNWPEVLRSRAAATHVNDSEGTTKLLKTTADYIEVSLRGAGLRPLPSKTRKTDETGLAHRDHPIDSGYHDVTPEEEREIAGLVAKLSPSGEFLHRESAAALTRLVDGLKAAGEAQGKDRVDAERWRALMSSQRMHFMGCAGIELVNKPGTTSRNTADLTPVMKPGEYHHFGMEFWSEHAAFGDPRYPDDFERTLLIAYVDDLRGRAVTEGEPDGR